MYTLDYICQVPLYKQLYNQIRERVLSGKLPANSKIQSVRDLAKELSTSRNTVESAYQELYAEGYIYSKPRSGYFVSSLDQEAALLSPSKKSFEYACPPDIPPRYDYDFHPARVDPQSFPSRLWSRLLVDSLNENSRHLTQYCDSQGEWDLRCNLVKYLERSRGVFCKPEQIVICCGLQYSLDIVAHLLKDRRKEVAVENPGTLSHVQFFETIRSTSFLFRSDRTG